MAPLAAHVRHFAVKKIYIVPEIVYITESSTDDRSRRLKI